MKTINLAHGDYEITLLTVDEYCAHKSNIPTVFDWWWLRSPGDHSDYAAFVYYDGSVYSNGTFVDRDDVSVRPALKSDILNLPIGEKFIALGNRWVMIDDGMAISEGVITHRRYDSNSNCWETSELKTWLEAWACVAEEGE